MASRFRGYFKETRRPVYSAALVFPFFLTYHIGTVFLETTYINGADALIIRLLSLFSVRSMFASAIVLLLFFVFWQLRSRAKWKIDSAKFAFLFVESLFFSLLLYIGFGWLPVRLGFSTGSQGAPGALQKLVLYCGAGIYEELVFRGFLLGVLILLLTQLMHWKRTPACITAAVAGSLLFAAFHYIGPAADAFTADSFLQRTLGGLYFSVLFVTRGFGITAASHALYDILIGLMLA
jgi:membrane protease YdiL (CAAX protease family)